MRGNCFDAFDSQYGVKMEVLFISPCSFFLVSFQKASDHELEEMFYDKFEVTLDDVQVMIFGKGRPELMLQF